MTVTELIRQLQRFPGDADVTVDDRLGLSWSDILAIEETEGEPVLLIDLPEN